MKVNEGLTRVRCRVVRLGPVVAFHGKMVP